MWFPWGSALRINTWGRKVESKIGKSSRYSGPTRASVGPAKLSCSSMALQGYPKLGRESLYAPHFLVIGCRAMTEERQFSWSPSNHQRRLPAQGWLLPTPLAAGGIGPSFLKGLFTCAWQCPLQRQCNSLFGFQTPRKITRPHLLSHNTFCHSGPVSRHLSGLFWDHGRSKNLKARLIHKA